MYIYRVDHLYNCVHLVIVGFCVEILDVILTSNGYFRYWL